MRSKFSFLPAVLLFLPLSFISSAAFPAEPASGWVGVSLDDTGPFDIACEYQAKYTDASLSSDPRNATAYLHPSVISPEFMGITNNSNALFVAIPASNKRIMSYPLSTANKHEAVKGVAVQAIWKRCP